MGILNLNFNSIINSLIYTLPAIVLALTVHEYSHARVAYHFGDPTAYEAGRLTLNPLRHLDILGSLMLILVGFGWAKPVPINPYYFQGDRRKKVMLVSVAGPASNLLQALLVTLLFALLLRFTPVFSTGFGGWLLQFALYFIQINLVLCVFNLIPLPPLDGSKILAGILPERYSRWIYWLDQYGYLILMMMVLFGVTGRILSPIVNFLYRGLLGIVDAIVML